MFTYVTSMQAILHEALLPGFSQLSGPRSVCAKLNDGRIARSHFDFLFQ